MRKTKSFNLKLDKKGTLELRQEMAKSKKIKVSIHLDTDMSSLQKQSKTGAAFYQTSLSQLLHQVLEKQFNEELRIRQLEKDLLILKKKKS